NPDEPREAEIAREMLVSGDAVVPHLNGEPFLEKPPLFYWMVVPAYRMAGGPGEIAARIVPALAGWLVILLVLYPGADLVGASAARLAAVVLMTSQQFFWTARRCMIDMPLTLAVLLACLAFHRALSGRSGERRGRILWLAAGSLLTGAAILLKGAIGAGIPALALIGFFASRRDLRGLLRLAPAALLALAPVAAWIALLQMRLGASGVREFVWVNNVLRFAGGAAKGHTQPFYYYLPTLLAEMAPWSLLLPFAVAAAWRAARPGAGGEAAGGTADRGVRADRGGVSQAGASIRFLLVWLLLPLLVLSLSSTKRGIYLLPLYPAAALLLGFWIDRVAVAPARGASRAARVALAIFLGAGVLIAALLPAALRLVRPQEWLGLALSLALPPALALFGHAALRSGRAGRLASLIGGALALVTLALAVAVVPEVVNGAASPRGAASLLRRMVEAGDRVALYRFKEGALGGTLFYAGGTLPNLATTEELRRHLEAGSVAGPGPRSVALMREEVYREESARLGIATTIVRRFEPPPGIAALAPGRAGPGPPVASTDDALVLIAAESPR
ncbi:MAG TPA: glycosyltransferase family 39 protein, partial [Candidatus Polarisedimenticolia bacterium]